MDLNKDSNLVFNYMSFIYSCAIQDCEKRGKNARHFAQCRGCLSTFCVTHADQEEEIVKNHCKEVQQKVDPEILQKLKIDGKPVQLKNGRFICVDCWNHVLRETGVIPK